jgi:CRP-like cAMP-binding protein
MADRTSMRNEKSVPVVSVPAGDFVFRTGDTADSFFVISAGQVELLRRGETHGRLALLTTGDLCGEDSAFEGQVRAYDARAVTSATLLRVNSDTFHDLIRARPEVASAVISWTALRLLQARAACLAMALPPSRSSAKAGNGTVAARFVHVESGSQFRLPAGSHAVVGRADPLTKFKPDIELSSVDAHRSLSRRHAVVTVAGNGYQLVEEPRVANGTFINGKRLSPGVAVSIKEGDEVSFGLIRTVFRTT